MKQISSNSTHLGDLLSGLTKQNLGTSKNLSIKGISLDSREIEEGFLFCALTGEKANGNHFIEEAFKKGALFCLTDSKEFVFQMTDPNLDPNILYLKDLKKNLGIISSRLFNNPSKNLETFAVTGTNGKTSCVELISQIAQLIKYQCGYISTIGVSFDGKAVNHSSLLTTPDPISLQSYFRRMVSEKTQQVAFEASSHGLDQHRVVGTSIDTAILTSFSQDHLDYHKNTHNYKKAKKKLFYELKPKNIILNTDNILGKEIYKDLQTNNKSCSFFSVSSEADADFRYSFSRSTNRYIHVDLDTPKKKVKFSLNTISRPLASNAVCAVAALISRGFDLDKVYPKLKDLKFPKGRMDLINLTKKDKCFIDYAHTPEALENSLIELKNTYKEHKLWCIFGCGGERDKDKRPKMGKIAESLSNFLIVTNDNPRSENELDIIKDIKKGIKDKKKVKFIRSRKEAIFFCLNRIKTSGEQNILLISGKGHEDYQDILGKKIKFSDHQQVKDFFKDG